MILINLTRIAVYIALAVLGWFDQAPWWAAPALVLYDTSYYWDYKTKAYKRYEASIAQYLRDAVDEGAMEQAAPKETDNTRWN